MNTVINEQDGKYIVSLEGELDTAHALEVEEAMKPLHEVSGKDITIDCSHLDYIASSGLRILLGLLKSAKANGNKVVLKSLNDEIKDVFKMTINSTTYEPLFEATCKVILHGYSFAIFFRIESTAGRQ